MIVTRALTVRQPYATLIVLGIKDVENRTWRTTHRGPMAIHAGKAAVDLVEFRLAWQYAYPGISVPDLPTGGIVGVVNLVDCVTQSDSPWFEGPVGWVLSDPAIMEFIPLDGRLGIWQLPEPLETK